MSKTTRSSHFDGRYDVSIQVATSCQTPHGALGAIPVVPAGGGGAPPGVLNTSAPSFPSIGLLNQATAAQPSLVPPDDAQVLVAHTKFLPGGHAPHRSAGLMPLRRALETEWATDAHFFPLRTAHAVRLTQARIPPFIQSAGYVCLNVLAVDIDDEESKFRDASEARASWRASLRSSVQAVTQEFAEPAAFYETRGGGRLLFELSRPFYFDGTLETWAAWQRHYVTFLTFLARQYDIIGDPKCKAATQAFRLPRVLRDGRREARPLVLNSPARQLDLDLVPPPSEADLRYVDALAARFSKWRAGVTALAPKQLKGRTKPRQRKASAPTLTTAGSGCNHISAEALTSVASIISINYKHGRHDLYLALAGALCSGGYDEFVANMVREIATAAGDPKVAKRVADAEGTVRRYREGLAVTGYTRLAKEWPDVAVAIAALCESNLIAAQLQSRLRARPKLEEVTAEHAVSLTKMWFIDAYESPGDVTLVVTPPGTGKSHAISNIALLLHQDIKIVASCASNKAADELTAHLKRKGVPVWQLKGVNAYIDASENPVCVYPSQAKNFEAAGISPRAKLCPSCDQRSSCQAYRDQDSGAGRVIVTNHALLSKALERVGSEALLVLDETPAFSESLVIDAQALREAVASQYASVFEQETAEVFARVLSAVLRVVEAPDGRTRDVLGELLEQFPDRASFFDEVEKAAFPRFRENASRLLRESSTLLSSVGTVQRVLTFSRDLLMGHATARWATKFDVDRDAPFDQAIVIVRKNRQLVDALTQNGRTVVLDATPDAPALSAIMRKQPVSHYLATSDGAPIRRVVFATNSASRKNVLNGKKARWRNVAGPLVRALSLAANTGAKKVLLITHKHIAAELAEAAESPIQTWLRFFNRPGYRLVTAHYGHLRSQNAFGDLDWQALDAVVTLGDPTRNFGALRDENILLGIDSELETARFDYLAESELDQAHGRLRPSRRGRPAVMIHVGRRVPLSWRLDNTEILAMQTGPLPSPRWLSDEQTKQAMTRAGSQRAFARLLGIPETTLRRYMQRGSSIPETVANRIERLLTDKSDPST